MEATCRSQARNASLCERQLCTQFAAIGSTMHLRRLGSLSHGLMSLTGLCASVSCMAA